MLEYEMIYNYSGVTSNDPDNVCLLIPELIKTMVGKINGMEVRLKDSDFKQNGKFNNGYCILTDQNMILRILREDGSEIPDLPKNLQWVAEYFSCDRLLIAMNGEYGYLDGVTGKIYMLEKGFNCLKSSDFSSDLAIMTDYSTKDVYLDKELAFVSPKYTHATPFVKGCALVYTDAEWQIIDKEFKPLLTFARDEKYDRLFQKIQNDIEEEVHKNSIRESNVIEQSRWSDSKYYSDKNTGFSIFMPSIISSIAQQLGVVLPDLSVREQLIWIVNEAAKKGTYAYILDKKALVPVEFKMGVRISDDRGSVVSYDDADVAFLRQRVAKENLDE